MLILILGLILFLGVHSVRIVAEDWRTAQLQRLGPRKWKLTYTVISAVGLVLIVWGYALARHNPVVVWVPPVGMRHIAALLTLIAFILLASVDIPRNSVKARLHHPMVIGVAIWAIAHLLANGMLADLVLFGAFLIWAVACWWAARRRDVLAGTTYAPGSVRGNVLVVVAGGVAWVVFALWLHKWLIGVPPFG